MSKAADIRMFALERCSVDEIAGFLNVPRCYVRHVLREWGLMPPTIASYPDSAGKREFASRIRRFVAAA